MTFTFNTSVNGNVVRAATSAIDSGSMLYLLTECCTEDGETGCARSSYSLCSAFCDGGENTESSVFDDVTSSSAEAFRLFDLISEGSVTPCTLPDIIADLTSGDVSGGAGE